MARTIVTLSAQRSARGAAPGWEFKGINAYGTMPRAVRASTRWMRASVPGTVHTDLMAAGVIPDPLAGMNENLVQWVDSQQWVYRRRFDLADSLLAADRIELVAEGLDTFAQVRINGRLAAVTANMFIAHRIDVQPFVRPGRNTIEILFDAPSVRTKALESSNGPLRVALEPHRVYARKAQYSFSWDWGPKLTTSGIWKGIRIEASSGPQLAHPFVRVVSADARKAILEISVGIEHGTRAAMTLLAAVADAGASVAKRVPVKGANATFRMEVPRPRLWWPNGYGDQPLYAARLSLYGPSGELDAVDVPFAIRTVALIQETDADGRSFIIEVNGVKIFCKGADWIPSDSFLPRISDTTYGRLLHYAKEAHMNMIRVWGGGIYEQDVFYRTCDALGLMVWQDFMFACGEYPQERWFLDEVKKEARSVVRRLRNHPSIVVWCGNNESEWLFCTENPGASPDEMNGARIFRDLLPAVCAEEDGTRPYWRSSPFGTGFPNGESDGTHHQWSVWSAWQDYAAYEKGSARFVAEFGFQAPANRKTFEEALLPRDWTVQSEGFEHHNKQVEGPERLFRFQSAHHRVAGDFDGFIYKCQLVQAEALKCAVEHWRRRKFRTSGALFWQLNDCWPVSSWAVIDSALRPKAAYYFAKKFYAPLLVSFKSAGPNIEVHVTNDRLAPVAGTLKLSLRSFTRTRGRSVEQPFKVSANSSRRVMVVSPERLGLRDRSAEYLHAELLVDGAPAGENRYFFAEPKRMRLPAAVISVLAISTVDMHCRLIITADRFVKYLRVEVEGEDVQFEDNYFDLDAGRRKAVGLHTALSVESLRKALRLRWLD